MKAAQLLNRAMMQNAPMDPKILAKVGMKTEQIASVNLFNLLKYNN